tara:strand:+ start:290 stop:529 length:240 start_codon:yes stop_codon:yes gene_type:complete
MEVYRVIPAAATAFAVKIESLPIHPQGKLRLGMNPWSRQMTSKALILRHSRRITRDSKLRLGEKLFNKLIHRPGLAFCG